MIFRKDIGTVSRKDIGTVSQKDIGTVWGEETCLIGGAFLLVRIPTNCYNFNRYSEGVASCMKRSALVDDDIPLQGIQH
jgi:hypothetical protein